MEDELLISVVRLHPLHLILRSPYAGQPGIEADRLRPDVNDALPA